MRFTEVHRRLCRTIRVFLQQAAQKRLFFSVFSQNNIDSAKTSSLFFSFSATGKSRIPPWSSHLCLAPQCQQQWLAASSLSVPPSTKRGVTKGTQITETTAVRGKSSGKRLRGETFPLHLVIGGLSVKSKVFLFCFVLFLPIAVIVPLLQNVQSFHAI